MNNLKKIRDFRDTGIAKGAFRRIRIFESLGWNYQAIRIVWRLIVKYN
jgi:hypothetical protein